MNAIPWPILSSRQEAWQPQAPSLYWMWSLRVFTSESPSFWDPQRMCKSTSPVCRETRQAGREPKLMSPLLLALHFVVWRIGWMINRDRRKSEQAKSAGSLLERHPAAKGRFRSQRQRYGPRAKIKAWMWKESLSGSSVMENADGQNRIVTFSLLVHIQHLPSHPRVKTHDSYGASWRFNLVTSSACIHSACIDLRMCWLLVEMLWFIWDRFWVRNLTTTKRWVPHRVLFSL